MVFRVVGRLTVRFFNSLGRLLASTGRAASRHLVSSLLVVLLLAGVGFALYQTHVFGLVNSSDDFVVEVPQANALSGQSGPAPSDASQELLSGLYHQDSQKIWDSLSDRYKASLSAQNINQNTVQSLINKQINDLKKSGSDFKYVKITMLGQTDLGNNSTLEGYTSYYRLGDLLGNADITVVLDKNQKVDVVQTPSDHPEPLVSAIFMGGKQAAADPNAQATAATSSTPKAQVGEYDRQVTKAAEDFMYGITNFDAGKIWDNLTPSYQKQLQDQKITQATIQQALDKSRNDAQQQKQTIAYQGYALIERVSLTNARTLSKYEAVFTVNNQVLDWEYLLYADSTGKIANVGGQDQILNKALGLSSQAGN